jgi:hypothetical protein
MEGLNCFLELANLLGFLNGDREPNKLFREVFRKRGDF